MLNKDGPKEVIKHPGPQVGYPIFWWAIRLVLEWELGGNVLLEPAAAMLHMLSLVMPLKFPGKSIFPGISRDVNPGQSTFPGSQLSLEFCTTIVNQHQLSTGVG